MGGLSVDIEDVSKEFENGVTALSRLHLKVAASEFISILGPSGCGKSTILRLISKLDLPTRGKISVDHSAPNDTLGKNLLSYVFQDAQLLPWRTVKENVRLPLELAHQIENDDLVVETLEQVGLSEFLSAYPHQLSGGMKMRVSLARALMTQPKLLLLDEPFAALDEMTRQRLDIDLRNLWQDRKMTVIFVTHSVSEAAFLSNRVVVLTKRPGQIFEDRKIDLPNERLTSIKTEAPFIKIVGELSEILMREENL